MLLHCASQIQHFFKLKVCGNPASSKSINTNFPNGICSLCVSVWHFGNFWIFQTFSVVSYLLHWSLVIFDVTATTAAKSLQSCPTLCDAIDGSPPGSPIPGFSRQEHWSGLPFPSPMHESEKWKWSRSVVSDSSRPHGLQPTRLLHPWDFPGKNTGVGCHRLLQAISPEKYLYHVQHS